MSKLWGLIQDHLDKYGVREAELARRIDTAPQTVNSWKKRGLKQLPERRLLQKLAEVIGKPYEIVLHAALVDTAYVQSPESFTRKYAITSDLHHPAHGGRRIGKTTVVELGQERTLYVSRDDGKQVINADIVAALEVLNSPEVMAARIRELIRSVPPEQWEQIMGESAREARQPSGGANAKAEPVNSVTPDRPTPVPDARKRKRVAE